MRKYSLMALFLILGIAVTGCKGPGCLVQEKVVDASTRVVVEKLECENFNAVRESVNSVVSVVGLCKTSDEAKGGPIADVVCPLVADAVVNAAFDNGVPSAWRCKGTAAKATVKELIVTQCKRLPVQN